jgi:hypothetical protein
MPQGWPSSRSLRAQRLCEVTVLVPEDCAERIRQFAQELRVRHRAESDPTPLRWLALSPSAELMISPDCSARCVVRDTRAAGGDRFRWTVGALGQLDPIAEGRAENREEARALAEAAVETYFANRVEPSGGGSARDG